MSRLSRDIFPEPAYVSFCGWGAPRSQGSARPVPFATGLCEGARTLGGLGIGRAGTHGVGAPCALDGVGYTPKLTSGGLGKVQSG